MTHDLTELDRMLAEKVMGWVVHHRNTAHYVLRERTEPSVWHRLEYRVEFQVSDWHPTTNIVQAFMVAEKIRARRDYRVEIILPKEGGACCQIEEGDEVTANYIADADADTPALAICLAAKAWLEARKEGDAQ